MGISLTHLLRYFHDNLFVTVVCNLTTTPDGNLLCHEKAISKLLLFVIPHLIDDVSLDVDQRIKVKLLPLL